MNRGELINLSWALGGILLVVAANCTSTDDIAEPQTEPVTEDPAKPPAGGPPVEEEEAADVLSIGDSATITYDGQSYDLTVSDLRIEETAQIEYGYPPDNGYFLIFIVDIEAFGSIYVDEIEFYVVMPDGTRYEVGDGNSWHATDINDQLGYVELNAGERTSGALVFDTPDTKGELAYDPNLDEGPIVSWSF